MEVPVLAAMLPPRFSALLRAHCWSPFWMFKVVLWLQLSCAGLRPPVNGIGACFQRYQVDWEAILSRSSEPFIASVSAWLYPPPACGEHAAQAPQQAPAPELAQLLAVKQLLGTARSRLEALNAPLPSKWENGL